MKLKKTSNKFRIIAVNNSKVVNNKYLVNTGFLSYFGNLRHMVFDTFMLNFYNGNVSHYMFTVFPVWGSTEEEEDEEEEEEDEEETEDDEDFRPTSVYDESWLDV